MTIVPPPNLNSLTARIRNAATADGRVTRRLELIVADTAVGQMLPPGVVKGGAAMQIRLGDAESRATRDLDAARAAELSLDAYLEQLDDRLAAGWAGFTGTVRDGEGPSPADVPPDYVMRPFLIRLSYRGSFWFNVPFELGRDEVGSTAVPELRMSASITDLFARLGLPVPEPIPLLPVDHQMAQSSMPARGSIETARTTAPTTSSTSKSSSGRRGPIRPGSGGRRDAFSSPGARSPGRRR